MSQSPPINNLTKVQDHLVNGYLAKKYSPQETGPKSPRDTADGFLNREEIQTV